LKRVAGDLTKADQSNAREAIEAASETIAKFVWKLLPAEPISTFGLEAVSKETLTAIESSLKESSENVQIYAADPNVTKAETACMANRKAIVYLYLARFGYQQIVNEEELRTFRTDINRTIYYNRILQEQGADKDRSDYCRLDKYSDSERRRLRLLQAIIDNDIQQAQVLLQIALIEAIPDIQS
jgi:hypothetical protein